MSDGSAMSVWKNCARAAVASDHRLVQFAEIHRRHASAHRALNAIVPKAIASAAANVTILFIGEIASPATLMLFAMSHICQYLWWDVWPDVCGL